MITLQIEYPVLFFTRRVKGRLPASWSELTVKQFTEIARNINGTETDFHFLSVLTSISEHVLRMLSPFHLLKLSGEICFFKNLGDFPGIFFIRKLHGTKLCSPKPKLEGMTFGQFIFADTYYADWLANKDPETLNKFIASLYMYPGEKFSEKTLTLKAPLISKTRLTDRLSIAYNYSLIIIWLQQSYPLVFAHAPVTERSRGAVIASEAKQPVGVAVAHKSGWLNLFDSLVADDLIHRNQYAKLPIHTVLGYLTQKYKEHARTT